MNVIEKRVNNESNVYRHFKVTQKIVNGPIPEWVKKAQAGFKSKAPNMPRDLKWAKKTQNIK